MMKRPALLLAVFLLPAAALCAELAPGDKGPEVLAARNELYRLGYYQKPQTQDDYSAKMADTVRAFEGDFGLTVDGALSEDDLAVLYAAQPPVSLPAPVLKVSENLISLSDGVNRWYPADLSWSEIKNAERYLIYRSDNKKGPMVLIGETTQTHYTDETMQGGELYYQVRAVCENSKNGLSAVKPVRLRAVYTEPACPVELVRVDITRNDVDEPRINFKVNNISDERSVRAFTFTARFIGKDGTVQRYYNREGMETMTYVWDYSVLAPHASAQTQRVFTECRGFYYRLIGGVELTVIDFTLEDGTVIEVPEDQRTTVTYTKKK